MPYWIILTSIGFVAAICLIAGWLVQKRVFFVLAAVSLVACFILGFSFNSEFYWSSGNPGDSPIVILVVSALCLAMVIRVLRELKQIYSIRTEPEHSLSSDFIVLKSKAVIPIDQIKYVKSDGPYAEFYLDGNLKPEVDRNTLKNISGQLDDQRFSQINKSVIVNREFIRSVDQGKVFLDELTSFRISKSFSFEV